jgi:3-deoxy-manno-octulosonate cytidylyltransferase (CMP-KDO synthetase)
MTSTAILIPARFGSTRFPGKPLELLDGVPMVKRVYNACKATGIDTYVLTDDMRIFKLFDAHNCWIDETDYANGTERCAGAITNDFFNKYNKFINVQGDMPDVTAELIDKCHTLLNYYPVSTVYAEMPKEDQDDPNTVKCVHASEYALWFGRGITGYGSWHLGVYGYRRDALQLYPTLSVTEEETIEQLEQLRWLKNGWQIGINPVYYNGTEINTPRDINTWHKKKSYQ